MYNHQIISHYQGLSFPFTSGSVLITSGLDKVLMGAVTDIEQKKEQFIDSADTVLLPIATTVESMHPGTLFI